MLEISESILEAQQQENRITYFPIAYPYAIAPLLSSISTLVAIIICLTTKSHKQPLTKMIIAINLSDFLFVFLKVVPVFIEQDWYCDVIQVISRFGIIACVVWTTLFAHAFMTIVKHVRMEVLSEKFRYYLIIGLVIPLATSLVALASKMEYNFQNNSCDYVLEDSFDWKNFVFFAMPLIFGCAYSCFLYIKTGKRLSGFVTQGHEKYILTLIIYPGILIVCWTPSLLINLLAACGVQGLEKVGKFFQAWDQLQGFFNGLAYTGSRKSVINALRKCCKCRRKSETLLIPDAQGENEHEMPLDGLGSVVEGHLSFEGDGSFHKPSSR